ncbi:protein CFAP20DC isoform X2 [Petromyzon marinus]|uniref:protein CFAP20DC isoform X2 n=1 Tax=Petromyzon marinus TaxID=7757 RepID=UPI003F7192D0
MFKKEFQGGESVEVFSAQGKDPTARWHLHGGPSCIQKVFARDVRGFVYTLEGSPQMTRMQLPKDSHQQLSLLQPYLAVQLNQAAGSDCSLELLVQDLGATRRRLYLSTAQREVAGTQLHARLPLASLPRSVWCVLVLDLASLSSLAFPGSTFSSLEGVAISASCRLRKILTFKTAPLDGFPSPRAFQLPPDVAQVTHLLDATAFRPQDAGPGDQLAGASASRAGSARGAPPESHIAFGSRMPGRAPPSGRQAISARAREPNTAATHRQAEDQAKEPCPPLRPSPGRRAPLVASPARRAQGSPHQPRPPQREPSGERAGCGGRSGSSSSRRNRIEGADPDRIRLQGNSPTVTSLVTRSPGMRSPVMRSPEMSPVMRSPDMSPVREMLRISIPVSTPSQSTDGWKFPKHLGDDLDFHWGRRPLPRSTPDPLLHLNLGGLDSDGGSYEGNEFEGDAGGGDTENDAVSDMVGDTGSDDENHASLGPDSEREGGALLDPKDGGSTMTKMFTFSSVPRAVWERGGCSPSTSPAPSPSSSSGPPGLGHHFGASPLRAGARLPAPPTVAPTPSSGLPSPSQGLPSTALPSTGLPSTGLPSTALPSANANTSTNGAGEMGAEGPGTGGRSGDPGWTARITRRSLREVATPRATTNRNGAVPPSWEPGTAGVHRAPLGPPDSLEASVLASLHRQQLAEARGEWGGGSARGPPVGHERALMSFGSDSERSLSSDDAGSCVLMGPGTPVGSRYQQEMQLLLSRRTGDEEDLAQSSTRGYSPPIILPSERMQFTVRDSVHSSQDAAPAGEEDMLELLYDPCLDCYFDPVSGKYYQLRD